MHSSLEPLCLQGVQKHLAGLGSCGIPSEAGRNDLNQLFSVLELVQLG